MSRSNRLRDAEEAPDALLHEPVVEPAPDQTTGLVPESLQRRRPEPAPKEDDITQMIIEPDGDR